MSLFEGETNAFHSPMTLCNSRRSPSFIAGILEHATEISAVTNQWVNSYKRLVHGGEAPTAASWGAANRSALVRVPMYTRARHLPVASRCAARIRPVTPT